MRGYRRVGLSGLVSIASFLLASSLQGQIVVGEVVEQATAAPVRGVFVALLDPAGERVAGVLTDERGRFTLRAPTPGRYALRADRIGFETVFSRPLEVAGGVMSHRFELASRAIQLEGVVVEAETRECELRPEEGTRIQEIWDQVRIAAEVAEWTKDTGYLRFEGLQYERLLDPVTRLVLEESVRPGRSEGVRAFPTLPVTELVTYGFVQLEDEHYVFHGLDAATIFSDDFLDTHCFRIRAPQPGHEGALGLAFEPARELSVPSVHGVLWLDEQTSELRSLEYAYTRLPWNLPADPFGGTTEFRRLPTGAWIVERWSIRMPQVERVTVDMASPGRQARDDLATLRDRAGLVIKEESGEVIAMYTDAGLRLPSPERAALQGVVHDSIGGGPLAGAKVRLEGTGYETTTDDDGEYRLSDLPDGVYTLTFTHEVLDTLGLEPPGEEVALERGGLTLRDLAVPSAATAFARACPAGAAEAAVGPVVGRVIDARTGSPLGGATVSLDYFAEEDPDRAGATLQAMTDAAGIYRFCDVPGRGSVVLSADYLGHGRAEESLPLSATDPVFHELSLSLNLPTRLAGQVVDAETGQPVRGVSVRLDGAGVEQVTGTAGRFLFREVPAGEYMLEVDHIAYTPVRESVRVDGTGRTFQVDVRLGTRAIPLTPVVVSAAARPIRGLLGSVYDRIDRVRLWGGGTVFDRVDIESRNPARLTHLVGGVPGVRVERYVLPDSFDVRPIHMIVSNRGISGGGACPMTLYLDGMLFQRGGMAFDPFEGNIDAILAMSDVEAVEIYQPGQRIPAQFGGRDAGCGVILIWTQRGPS